ncbi:L protein [Xiburema virus]|uniref:RNA-directed RNA polymerase L n=2 Tax=Xiburema virus TaxID=1272959 RepID=A0A059U1X5_9RHAB|nr:L protein [Xiburema virus]AHZ45724.1 L protein [Xiburema virus]
MDFFNDDCIDEAGFEQWEQIDDDLIYESDIGTEFYNINSKDYNLNSPIILDAYNDLRRAEKGHPTETVVGRGSKEIDEIINMRKIHKAYREIPNGDTMYKRVYSSFLINKPPTDKPNTSWSQLLKHVCNVSEETKKICEAFIRKMLPQYKETLLGHLNDDILQLGERFWLFHKMTLILNHSGPSELEELMKSMRIEPLITPSGIRITKLPKTDYGDILIFENFVYFIGLDIIIPKSVTLMLKDIFISRFQNILSMIMDLDQNYTSRDILKLMSLYSVGDRIIAQSGNKGFDVVKMVEPICNLQLYDLSRQRRPLIPEFTAYRGHIEKSVTTLKEINPDIEKLFHIIESATNVELVLNMYGAFRHWGHPYIEYEEGLEALYRQVTMEKSIDTDYSEALASDLAYKILKKQFFEKKCWFVDPAKVPNNDKMKEHITKNTWPTYAQVLAYGDNWHKLPLTQCFEIPDLIDPSSIYSDKAHSLNRQELIDHLQINRKGVVKTKRVLNTMLNTPATDWKSFFQKVNDIGIPDDALIIGLKAKEREMKRVGRFFSLMSWELREYFVSTEYLIKKHFVPLFKGLTMADGLMTVTKKMLESSMGQGNPDYETVSIANHVDYEKWNNHQRRLSNQAVFRVMGQFLGYPNLISRTHEFFEKSWIYYAGRCDRLWTDGNKIGSSGSGRYFWNGQAGGLEGLRQKGWSILNYLVIEREAKMRNTVVKVLAQGDNQTITTTYKIQSTRTKEELKDALANICKNNQAILDGIIEGTKKLGLIINFDETVQAADYMNYGKVPIYQGVIRGLTGKRWSRANFVTNDQLPSFANVLSSISTNALTACHFSRSPLTSIYLYNFIGCLGIEMLNYHNPAIRGSPYSAMRDAHLLQRKEFRAIALFLDPSLGGISGTNLNRFLIRMFPDPVTESLTFWKKVYENTDQTWIKSLCVVCGNPELKDPEIADLDKLIEDPTGLNIRHGINVNNIIKEEIKKQLIETSDQISNDIMRHCATYLETEEQQILAWIKSIEPLFPRFVSELYNATFLGTVRSMLGLFINSRTIRNTYKKKYRSDLDKLIIKSEMIAISSMLYLVRSCDTGLNGMWICSSEHADLLRRRSWGTNIVGMTVPHPCEFIDDPVDKRFCLNDVGEGYKNNYITVMFPKGIPKTPNKGPYVPYLGSNTSEGTSIMTPWERETNIPMIQRATRLRNAISWFVEPDSPLSESILGNLKSLTGLDWSEHIKGFKRTGSAIHRFSSSRVSAGGFAASSPWALTWLISTTDTLSDLNESNYDFMFQSMLIWSQIRTVICHDGIQESGIQHTHIACDKCIRPIEEITLSTPYYYQFKDVNPIIRKWIPGNITDSISEIPLIQLNEGDWEMLSTSEKGFQIGAGIGFVYSDMCLTNNWHMGDSSLYPISLRNKLSPSHFFRGLLIGMMRGASINLVNRRNLLKGIRSDQMLWGTVNYVIDSLSEQEQFITMINMSYLYKELTRYPHKVPCSYPPSLSDCGIIFRGYMRQLLLTVSRNKLEKSDETVWIFSDLQSPKIMYPLLLSVAAGRIITKGCLNKTSKDQLRDIQERYIKVINDAHLSQGILEKYLPEMEVYLCSSEIRHAAKNITLDPRMIPMCALRWTQELACPILTYPVHYGFYNQRVYPVPKYQNPLISSMRLVQLSTGAHYKLRSILRGLNLTYRDFICGGDGSGGMTSCLLRYNKFARGIFNSLLELEDHGMKGSRPPPPSAVLELGSDGERCLNLYSAWEESSNLANPSTWVNFIKHKRDKDMDINLMVFDMEVRESGISNKIEENLLMYSPQLVNKGVIIYKTYCDRLLNQPSPILEQSSRIFHTVSLVTTEVTSSQSSEVYFVGYLDINQIQNRVEFVNKEKLYSTLKTGSPVFQTLEDEFKRALRLKRYDFEMGIPMELKIHPQDELIGLFVNLGLQSGYAMHLLKDIKLYQDDSSTTFIMCLIVLTLNGMFALTDRSYDKKPLPSDNMCKKSGVLWIGFLNWLSLVMEDFKFHKSAQDILDQGLYVSKRLHFKNRYLVQLGSGKGSAKNGQTKNLYLDNMMSDIGSVTRGLIRGFRFKGGKVNKKMFNMIISNYNRGLLWEKFGQLIHLPQLTYI